MLIPAMQPTSDHASLTADDTVTGEAVAFDLPAAGIGPRMVAGLLDVVLTVAVLIGTLFLAVLAASQTDAALLHVATIGSVVVALLVVPTTVETLSRGRSPGKWAMGLRVVRDDAGPITAQHAFVRALVAVVETYALTGAGAFFSILLSPRGKRLGDHAAGTYVVLERVRLVLPPPTAMPQHLGPWARGADISALPTPLALGVRQFLGRAQELTPASREELAHRLAAQVVTHVAPPPPPGTHPELFLAAVLAARRERDGARFERERSLRQRLTSARTPGR
ncbi:RDD family protein [Nocardioides gilvus]|uniref:RDD family protein n=1 Tax=Nocardioides gilvus TaxID=1735589 RepID=UPI001EF732F8|nr:RDD family protein [Nocardioides gilvus]